MSKILLGVQIGSLRRELGMSQKDLAAKAGLLPEHISEAEENLWNPPPWALEKIAEALHCEVEIRLRKK